MSARGLAKRCERFSVPVPPRGHWQRVEAGQLTTQPEFPLSANLKSETIVIDGSDAYTRATRWAERKEASPQGSEIRTEWERYRLQVSTTPAQQTAGTRRTAANLVADHLVILSGPPMALTSALKHQLLRRNLDVLQRISAELIQRQATITQDRERSRDFIVCGLQGGRVQFSLTVGTRQFRRELTPKELASTFRFLRSSTTTQVRVPTGGLKLAIRDGSRGIPREWIDDERPSLHEHIPEIVASLLVSLNEDRKSALKRKAEQVEARRLEELRIRRRARLEQLAGLRTALLREASDRRQAALLRKHVASVLTRSGPDGQHVEEGDLRAWSEWALSVADDLEQSRTVTAYALFKNDDD